MSLVMAVMEVMTVQRIGDIMKQSSASARCIPDWQMIVHHNLKAQEFMASARIPRRLHIEFVACRKDKN